jgi:Guanosine polyphosphate pyrophosphohydrolases/synthetases
VTALYNKSLKIATMAHKGQVDKADVDYIEHPKYVASLVDADYEVATALLHDVVSDLALKEWIRTTGSDIMKTNENKFGELFLKQTGVSARVAAIFGYDAIYIENINAYLVLNRGVINYVD